LVFTRIEHTLLTKHGETQYNQIANILHIVPFNQRKPLQWSVWNCWEAINWVIKTDECLGGIGPVTFIDTQEADKIRGYIACQKSTIANI
jgi:hypothetical protein